jgi:ATP-binding cassette subfamily C (CFTR/MRP) protein 1
VQIICAWQWLSPKNESSKISLVASLFTVASTGCLAILSYLEHDRSIDPSSVITIYLLISGLCDIPILRTLWLRQEDTLIPLTRALALFLKTVIFVLESKNKRNYLEASYRNSSPEALGGMMDRGFFLWLIPTLRRGYYVSLELDDLPYLDPELSVPLMQARFAQTWKHWPKSRGRHPLLFATFTCFRGPLLALVLPRLFSIMCKFSQPLLIEAAVKLMSKVGESERRDIGLMLTGAAVMIYVGIAVGTATYKHKIYRAMLAFRSGLIGIIHDSSLVLNSANAKDVAAVTLMSTDVDRIIAGIEMLDVIWATPIEVVLAIFMLGRQLGWACLSPLLISVSMYLDTFINPLSL